jgi:hypothetical protein
VIKLGRNSIADEGCRHLVKGKWINLAKLYLGPAYNIYLVKKDIGDKGLSHLSQGKWAHSAKLYLGTAPVIFRRQRNRALLQ